MRTKRAPVREVQPDQRFNSVKVAKFISAVMKDGKKSVAQKQVYGALEALAAETKKEAVDAFEDVLNMVSPQMEVRSRRVGGAAYQVPMPVRPRRAFALALRWIIEESRKRSSRQYHTFAEKLTAEMLDALQNTGGSINRKLTAHRMAEANKAFAHFRW